MAIHCTTLNKGYDISHLIVQLEYDIIVTDNVNEYVIDWQR